MSQEIKVAHTDLLHQAKLDCQIPTLIQGIARRKILATAVAEAGITVETAELQQAADQLRLMNQLKSAEETWIWLQTYELSIDDFEEIVRTKLLVEKLANHLFEEKVEAYFFEHQLDYMGAVIYEIILEDEELAIELFYAIQEKEVSFFDVARQYIQDPEEYRVAGYRGVVNRQDLQPEISTTVFSANPPQVLRPVITARGVLLIFVEEIIQPILNQKLQTQILSNLFESWVKREIEGTTIIKQLEMSSQAA